MEADKRCYLATMEAQIDDLRGRVRGLLGPQHGPGATEDGALARVREEIGRKLQELREAYARARSATPEEWPAARNELSACCARMRVDLAELERSAREQVLRVRRVEPPARSSSEG